jgi:hypothetical protein
VDIIVTLNRLLEFIFPPAWLMNGVLSRRLRYRMQCAFAQRRKSRSAIGERPAAASHPREKEGRPPAE